MEIDILSLFPEYFKGPFDVSMIKKAREKGIVDIRLTDIRKFATDKHAKVDDRPYGGGPGMVMMPEPLCSAIRSVRKEGSLVVYLTPQGAPLTAKKCKELALSQHLILVCGHYEGVDERVLEKEVDEEISVGDYVLMSGCPAAIVLVEATVRFIPGVLGHEESAEKDSFQQGMLEGPVYTRPEVFEGLKVPQTLLSGNHAEIAKWQQEKALEKTIQRRPDLLGR